MKIGSLRSFPVALKKIIPAVLLLGTFSLATTARGQITIAFTYEAESGGSVTANYTIAENTLSNSEVLIFGTTQSGNSTETGVFSAFGPSGNFASYRKTATTEATPWDRDPSVTATWSTQTGVPFGFDTSVLYAPTSYVLSTALVGSMTITGSDLINLGFGSNDAASGSFVMGGYTVNWTTQVGSAVPEPSAYAVILGVAGLGFAAMRRRPRRIAIT